MGKQVRISGLVRAADVVRRELSGPITAQRRESLRQRVQENLRQTLEILRQHRATPKQLPAPSQRAYEFLANLDWAPPATVRSAAAVLPPAASGEQTAENSGPSIVSWRGLAGLIERTMNRLAVDVSCEELSAICQSLQRTSRQMELTIARQKLGPERLSPTTREQRGWVAFFSREENLRTYVQARRSASRHLDAAAAGSKSYPPPLTILFRPIRGIYKLRAARRAAILSLPTPMVGFDDDAFYILAEQIYGDRGQARQQIIEKMTGEGYQAVRAELESLGGIVETTRGAVHDLAASFDRVNATYFAGQMPRPRLTWNRTFTGRKFGHYDWILDTVMVSRSLDAPGVPEFVVDFLVFHELLHKFHGLHWVNGRGFAHTNEFLRDERKFLRYDEAEAALTRIARAVR